jgi:hypothetical protein
MDDVVQPEQRLPAFYVLSADPIDANDELAV